MLIRFCWKNFLSFSKNVDGSAVEFSPLAGKVRSKSSHVVETAGLKVLRFSALYGANASGKSNFVKALAFFQTVIARGSFPSGTIEKWCRIDEQYRNELSYFEMQFEIGGVVYAYGFEAILSSRKITSEWLLQLSQDDTEKIIFERNLQNDDFQIDNSTDAEYQKRIQLYLQDYSKNTERLFLSYVNQSGLNFMKERIEAHPLEKTYQWITGTLKIVSPTSNLPNISFFEENTVDAERICHLLKALDTGIESFHFESQPLEKLAENMGASAWEHFLRDLERHSAEATPNNSRLFIATQRAEDSRIYRITVSPTGTPQAEELKFNHRQGDFLFHLGEESDGTIRMLVLLQVLLISTEKVYVIDEIDRCLHPNMTYQYVSEFLQRAATEPNLRTQLIVTSHESRLLDFRLLRRDEIWFVDKGQQGDTELYSLEQYSERFDRKVDKAYLEGRYGGVPVFSTLFPIHKD